MARSTSGLLLGAAFALIANVAGAEGACLPGTEVGRLVSMIGDVRINGVPPVGELPFVPMCAGDLVTVGTRSRAGIYLLDADTPVRLDQDTVARIEAASTPDSGLFDLTRGAIYFLSQVRRTLTIRTPYVNAGIEGTEVYLRVREAAAELIVLEGRVALAPGAATTAPFAPATVATGERADVAATGAIERTTLPSPGGRFGALREVAVGALSWTLFYPDVLTEADAAQYPRIAQASRLLAAGQVADAETVLAAVPATGTEAGLAAALRAIIAVGRKDAATAAELADQAVALAPASPVPQLALSYARQLALDLDGAFAAAEEAARLGPDGPVAAGTAGRDPPDAGRDLAGAARGGRGGAAGRRAAGADGAGICGAGRAAGCARRGGVPAGAAGRELEPAGAAGAGLAQIKQGDLGDGTVADRECGCARPGQQPAAIVPWARRTSRSGVDELAGTQYAIAKELDPTDPTPWLYDAIRKQLDNRPIEALRDVERSIELNDNRAPFRSRLLLDEDAATRAVSLGRIYDDLSFRELGINTAGRSLALDPASPAAHRFLADLLRGVPRQEVARASELLQSQLLQDPNLQPIQPTLPFTDLDIVAENGPRRVGFNEFTPLFVRDGIHLDAAGTVGSYETRAGEAGVATLVGRTSVSASAFHYETDGFRDNFDLRHDIQNLFAQTLLAEGLSLQGEYRHRDTHSGDRRLQFDPDDFEDRKVDIDEQVYRVGGRYSLSPAADLVLSYIHTDQDENDEVRFAPDDEALDHSHVDTNQLEIQLLARVGQLRVILGAGRTVRDGDVRTREITPEETVEFTPADVEFSASGIYGQVGFNPTRSIDFTLRMGWDDVDLHDERLAKDTGASGLTPGMAVAWLPVPGMTLRAAVARNIRAPYAAEQTLRPTQLAGFSQIYDEFEGVQTDQLDLGIEQSIGQNLTIGTNATWRRLTRKLSGDENQDVKSSDVEDDRLLAFAYWSPTDRLAFAIEPTFEHFRAREQETSGDPVRVRTYAAPLTATWFDPAGWYATARATPLRQDIESPEEGELARFDNSGVLIDLGIGYRFPARRGTVGLRIDNLLDSKLSFVDESLRTEPDGTIGNPRFIPARTFLVAATINF